MDKIITNEPSEIIRITSSDDSFVLIREWPNNHLVRHVVGIILNRREAKAVADTIYKELKND